MRAATIHSPYDIRVEDVPDPGVRHPGDAVVQVLRACVCGTDLWAYRGESARQPGQRLGHEFLGTVSDVGADVTTLRKGDLVVAPLSWSDGECVYCAEDLPSSCPNGGIWGAVGSDGGQGEAVRVPYADSTLVKLPADAASDDRLLTALLTLADVLGTGYHAALSAGARPGASVAVVGDGAVGLCAVMAAGMLGAENIVILGRHPARLELAGKFGATAAVTERGDAAVEAVRELTGGHGVHASIEAAGTADARHTAIAATRPGGAVGWVGAPHGSALDTGMLFIRSITLRGGIAPVRVHIPALLPSILDGTIDPSPVFDAEVTLDAVADGYQAMNTRTALKVLVKP